jgi:dephospho-CoA kinase
MFEALGVPVFDADAVVRQMQGPGGALVPAIGQAFPGTTDSSGVDRDTLGQAVFADPEALGRLEAIVHPAVRAAREEFLTRNGDAKLVVFDIPLLFEKGGVEDVAAVLVVSASPEVQKARVLARPGLTPGRLASILALQMPDAEKRARADFVIDTGRPLAETQAEIAALVDKLRKRLPG